MCSALMCAQRPCNARTNTSEKASKFGAGARQSTGSTTAFVSPFRHKTSALYSVGFVRCC